MDKTSGNRSTGNPLETDDPRFNVLLVKAVGQLLTRREYRAPVDPAEAEQAYQDFVFVLALLVQAFEGKDHGAFRQIARSYGRPATEPNATAVQIGHLDESIAAQRALIAQLDDALGRLT